MNRTISSSRGISFVEMLVATAVLTIIASGIFALLNQSQRSYQSQQDLTTVIQQGRVGMDQIATYLRGAGNDPTATLFSAATPTITLLGGSLASGSGYVRIDSDITGAVTDTVALDATGDPDGALTARYEQVVVRYDAPADNLYMNIGDGEQLLVENVATFLLTFFDGAGGTPATAADIVKVHVKLEVQTGSPDPETGKTQTLTLESDVFLRSKSYNLFDTL